MKVSIMQPYIFPYIGYFQLIDAADRFVFLNDVNFIKKGWIHKNRIAVNNQVYTFSIPLIKASQNKLIKDTQVNYTENWQNKLLKTIETSYKKAPYFEFVFPIIADVLNSKVETIDELAKKSVVAICDYLGLSEHTDFYNSSQDKFSKEGKRGADRIISIVKSLEGTQYINAQGGRELYDNKYFDQQNIELGFIETKFLDYKQLSSENHIGLSILDVIMNCSIDQSMEMVKSYQVLE